MYEQQQVCCERDAVKISGVTGYVGDLYVEFDGQYRDVHAHVCRIIADAAGMDVHQLWQNWNLRSDITSILDLGRPNQPRPSKAVSNAAYKRMNVKLLPEHMQKLGELFSNFDGSKEYEFDITSNLAWSPGSFGESSGSCWWGDYNEARVEVMPTALGMAVRTYKGGKGNARAWIVPLWHPHKSSWWAYSRDGLRVKHWSEWSYVGFNAYGHPPGLFAALLKHRLQQLHPDVKFKMDTSCASIDLSHGYVNGPDSTFVVAPEDNLLWQYCSKERRLPVSINYCDSIERPLWAVNDEYGEGNRPDYTCYHCGEGVWEDDVYWGSDDEPYCEACYSEFFTTCEICDTTCSQDDTYAVRSNNGTITVCQSCLDNYCQECDHCGEFLLTEKPHYYWRNDCTMDVHEVYESGEEYSNESWCQDCIDHRKDIMLCEECDKYVFVPELWEHSLCEVCLAEREEDEQVESEAS